MFVWMRGVLPKHKWDTVMALTVGGALIYRLTSKRSDEFKAKRYQVLICNFRGVFHETIECICTRGFGGEGSNFHHVSENSRVMCVKEDVTNVTATPWTTTFSMYC